MPTLPSIDVSFKALASSVISRSERGTAILILSDTASLDGYLEYRSLSEVDIDKLDETGGNGEKHYNIIEDVFRSPVDRLIVYIEANDSTLGSRVLSDIQLNHESCWIYTDTRQSELVTWIKEQEKAKRYYKALVIGESGPDCCHIVNVGNTGKVVFEDERGEQSVVLSAGVLLGVLASANVERGVTRAVLPGIKRVVGETLTEENAMKAGKLLYINSPNGARISLGINSSVSSTPDDMRYIENVEVCDMISEDITKVFEDEYLGVLRNSLDNQMLLISAINGYFKSLAIEGILDEEYDNKVDIDVAAQRAAWVASGVNDASAWSDTVVKTRTFKRSVFLAGSIKILGTVDTLKFVISLT